jgi:excisionase family DNA binding protein
MDLGNPYDVLNAYFPGRFRLEKRLRPDEPATAAAAAAHFNLNEAAEYLGVTQRHLKDLARDRRIVFSKPNYRTFSFRKEDLDAFLDLYRSYRS